MKKQPTRGGRRPGAGRPKSGRVQVTLQLLRSTVEKLESMSSTRLGQAKVIDHAIRRVEFLEKENVILNQTLEAVARAASLLEQIKGEASIPPASPSME